MAELVLTRAYYYPELLVFRMTSAVVGILETLIALRFILKLLGASPASQFIARYYELTERLVAPFAGAFPTFALSGFTVESASILAMLAYAVIGWLVVRIFALIFSTT